ncbi:hypothetical protein F4556_000412 [Kitasatospora gansuensis]|uniref:DUF2335 domain-containing protein n=1 Tax=Kitasatospora gansuensis TaxID=258050 RepID=A0A7W7WEK8_9ACTN|nr:hypothetical protein [Kitasatospora gansuensis]MBB4944877.1 hypothetical protein [Kitasatospora gansuensis]
MTQDEGRQTTGSGVVMEYARQWSKMPAEQLKLSLGMVDKQMAREHEQAMLFEKLRHRREMTGMAIGGLLALGSLALTLYLAPSQPWVAATTGIGSSVSLVTVIGMFVLKRSPSTADLKLLGRPSVVPQPTTPVDPAPIAQP